MEETPVKAKGGLGCFTMLILIIFLITIAAVGTDVGIGWYASHCGGSDIINCILNKSDTMDLTPTEKASMVTATGTYSYKDHTVQVTAHIPLSGGPVNGVVTGDCTGTMKGSFWGVNGGGISGSMTGACPEFLINIPASATYQGNVNEDTKIVRINFTGHAAGFSRQDSMTLSY